MTDNKETVPCLMAANAHINDMRRQIDALNREIVRSEKLLAEMAGIINDASLRRVASEKEAELSLLMMIVTMIGSVVWLVTDNLF